MSEQDLEPEDLPEDVADQEPAEAAVPETPEAKAEREESEAEARKYGWKPREEYTLDPKGWMDAERFLDSPATQRKMLRDLRHELKERDTRLSRIDGMSKQAIEAVRRQEREKFEAEVQQLSLAKREAAKEGNLDRYDELAQAEAHLRQRTAPTPRPGADEMTAFLETTPWARDRTLYGFAAQAIEANPEVMAKPPIEQAKWADAQMRVYFPHLFKAPEPQQPQRSRVDGGGLAGGFRRSKGADDLPPEALAAGKEWVAAGVFKSLDDYAKDYWAQS